MSTSAHRHPGWSSIVVERRKAGEREYDQDTDSHLGRELGAGTLLMAGLAMLALLLIGVTALMLQVATAASEAATAADLAALAAADAARGITVGEPCAAAEAVTEQHGAELVLCEVGGTGPGTVVVRVAVETGGPLPDALGSARAGPPG